MRREIAKQLLTYVENEFTLHVKPPVVSLKSHYDS